MKLNKDQNINKYIHNININIKVLKKGNKKKAKQPFSILSCSGDTDACMDSREGCGIHTDCVTN